MSDELLTLHRIEIPYAGNSVELCCRQHVALVRAPVEACNGGIVGARASTYRRWLLDIADHLCLMFLELPYLDTLSTRGDQIAAGDWLPQNF